MSPEIWRYIFDAIDDPIFLHDSEYRLLLANRAYCREAGVSEAEALGKPYWEVFPPGTGPLPGCKDTMSEGHAGSQEETSIGARLFTSTGYAVRDEQGKRLYSLHILSDITGCKQAELHLARLNRMYRTISLCNQTLVRAGDELQLAREMCQVLVEMGGFRAAWVGYADSATGKRIRPVATAGFEQGEIEAMNLTWEDNEHGRGPTSTAVRTGKTVISQDILNDPLWMPWREQAERLGLVAAIAIPLQSDGKTFGVIDIYGAETDAFAPDMRELLAELAGDLAFGIGNLRARAERMGILEKLEHSLDHAVTAIAAKVEMRDPYTAGHQRRVAKLAVAIAQATAKPESIIIYYKSKFYITGSDATTGIRTDAGICRAG